MHCLLMDDNFTGGKYNHRIFSMDKIDQVSLGNVVVDLWLND